MPKRPPKGWWDKTYTKVRQSLKSAHPEWKDETLEDRTRMTVGDIWYNKLSPEKKKQILSDYESEAFSREIFDAHDQMCAAVEDVLTNRVRDMRLALAAAFPDIGEGTEEMEPSDSLDRKTDSDQDGVIPAAAAADEKDKKTLRDTLDDSGVEKNITELDAKDRTPELDHEHETGQPDVLQESITDPKDVQGGGGDKPDSGSKLELEAKEQSTKERKELEDSQFAYPEGRKLPINDAAHVRNALARYNQTDLPSDKKAEVLGRICRAAKKFGIDSDLCKSKGKATASKADGLPQFMSVPAYRTPYVAAPKFGGKEGEIIIKALVLEEGPNVNGWQVDPNEFTRVADQYSAGRQLRVNHSKDMEDVIGKSFKAQVLKGTQIEQYMGAKIDGINPAGVYVAAEFEANPADPQIRTNILQGYVETGSIGLDAKAFCAKDNTPIEIDAEGHMKRTCHHYDSPIVLRDVDVKEYSYVAEPAFSHSIAVPSFAAAVDKALHTEASSLRATSTTDSPLSVQVQASAEGRKKAEGESEADAKVYSKSEADAIAEQRMADYKRGLADASKFRADAEGDAEGRKHADADAEGEGKSEADAEGGHGFAPSRADAQATDQATRIPITTAPPGVSRDVLLAKVLTPTAYMAKNEPWIKEVFVAAANHPRAPAETKRAVKGLFG
ncbi:MAG TPA: DUF6582 domain-containing protein [Nitrososphaerales archaeon]|nr:DUF6582 domain-containing protein [Nitrososphaerales archaeon]